MCIKIYEASYHGNHILISIKKIYFFSLKEYVCIPHVRNMRKKLKKIRSYERTRMHIRERVERVKYKIYEFPFQVIIIIK